MKINVNEKEALRYAGIPEDDFYGIRMYQDSALQMIETIQQTAQPKTTWKCFDLLHTSQGIQLAGTNLVLSGRTAQKMLSGCTQVLVIAGTLGVPFDFSLQRYMARNMQEGLLFDACGSATVEALMDSLEKQIREYFVRRKDSTPDQDRSPMYFTDRFSCGYGDLPLDLQKEIGELLELPKTTGIHVTDSLMMNPTKSVTAFIGISDQPQPARIRGCAYCSMNQTCTLRKEGKYCGG